MKMSEDIQLHKAVTYTLAYLLIVMTLSGIYILTKIDNQLKTNNKEILRQQEKITLQQVEIDSYKDLARLRKDLQKVLP